MHEIVMDAQEIEACYKKVGEEISQSLKNEEKRPILLCVMKGAMTFLIGMMKYVDIPVIVDYIHISSYDGTSTTGKVNLLKDMTFDPEGRTIVIVEDVVDTGISMKYLEEFLATKNPKAIKVAAFVDKPARREVEVKIDKSNGQIIIKVPGGGVGTQDCRFAERLSSSSIEFFYTNINWDAKIEVE